MTRQIYFKKHHYIYLTNNIIICQISTNKQENIKIS